MMAWDVLAALVLVAVTAAAASIAWSTLRLGISPMPSSRRVRAALLELVPREVDGEVHELGAGWGGLALALADARPRARVVAWEASFVPWLVCRLRLALRPRPNLELRRRDFFEADLSGAQVVVCYLWTGAMTRLAEKFAAELKDGAVVLSQTFALRGWTAETTRVVDDVYRTPVYRYVVKRGLPSP
jgi:hypothetical protein